MEKFALFGKTPIFYIDEGKGEPIILLHGYLESALVWDNIAANLKRTNRVIRLDLPGHGLSGCNGEIHTMEYLADAVRHVLTLTGVEKCTLVGHSMGGYVTLAFAKKYPDLLNRFILFHSTPNPDSEEKKANRDREIELVKEDKMELIARTNAPMAFARDNRKRFAEAIEECIEMYIEHDKNGIIANLNGMKVREDMNLFLEATTIPYMFIFGRKDNYITIEVAEGLISRYPAANVTILDNSGHMGFIEEAKVSLDAITSFANNL